MLMKKICVLLVGLLAMFSCEREDLEGIMNNDTGQALTRATSSIADFDPISELNGIPVNILNVGNTTRRYLSCAKSGSRVELYTKDDGSLRQRWYLSGGIPTSIELVGGNNSFSGSDYIAIGPNNLFPPDYPKLVGKKNTGNILDFKPIYQFRGTSNYYFITLNAVSSGIIVSYNLQSNSNSGSDLRFKTDNGDLAKWEIVPVGEFRLVDIQYEKSVDAGDFIIRKDITLNGAVFPAMPEVVEHSLTVSRTIRHNSTFSETTAVTTQNQSSFHLGIQAGVVSLPTITVGGDISNTTTSSYTVGYTDTEGYDETVSQTFKIVVPANTPYTVEILKMAYQTSVTYVATFQKTDGVDAGKRFRVKGKWDGVVTTKLYYNAYRTDTKELVETRVIDN